ncbi:MAG: DUF2805 domain-containing protein [Orrella sp.]
MNKPLKRTDATDAIATLDSAAVSEIIEMALSDHVSFGQIEVLYGLNADQVKTLMREQLKPGSYRAWRRRVRRFGDHRASYK